jgi:Ca2+/Na+ antiporter
VPLAAYVAGGVWVLSSGTRLQRLLIFGGTALLLVLYVLAMATVLPDVLRNEILCAEQGMR